MSSQPDPSCYQLPQHQRANARAKRTQISAYTKPPHRYSSGVARRRLRERENRWVPCIRDTLWTVAELVCVGLCAWHLVICVDKFVARPIGTNIRVETFVEYPMPGLTFCPATNNIVYDFKPQFARRCRQHKKCASLSDEDQQHFPFDEINATLVDMWRPKTNVTINAYAQCLYAVNSTRCNSPDWIQRSHVDTVAGPCQAFKTNLLWRFVGKSWLFWMEVETAGILDLPLKSLSVDLYVSKSPNVEFFTKGFILPNANNIFEILVTKFEYLNTSRNPCITEEEEENQGTSKRVAEMLQTADAECRWPFMDSSALPLCNSLFQVGETKKKILQLQFSPENTDVCRRPCRVITYAMSRTDELNHDLGNKTVVTLILKQNTRQIVTEYYSYPFSTLVSDVGGSVGLFLGISVLSSFKSLRQFIDKLNRRTN